MIEILYIEDNEYDRLSFAEAMNIFREMEISYATTISEAKEMLNSRQFRLIICDLHLPDGTAYDILDMKTEAPVIVLTGQGDEESAIKAIQKGAKDYIFKDFNSKHLNILPVIIEKTMKLADAELAQARLAAIVESAGDAIMTIDLEQNITTWNHGAEEIYGYTNLEAIGKPCVILCTDEGNPLQKMIDCVKSTHVTMMGEFRHLKKNGKEFDVYLSLSPVWDSAGKICCISFISKDITEIKRKQALLRNKEEELKRTKEIDAQKDEFIGVASHELKTPLTTLKAYVQLLEKQVKTYKKVDPANFITAIEKTGNYIQKMEVLINDLFSISRIQSGKLSYHKKPFDFDSLIIEAVDSLSKCTQHTISIYGKTNAIVEGDRIRLEEVINNYLTNAIKFSPDKKEIKVILTRTDHDVTVCVKDQGVGIREEDIGRIFQKYYRSNENAYKFPGLGVGLYISREIVNRHHGKVWVVSTKGNGAEFYFTVPLKQPEKMEG